MLSIYLILVQITYLMQSLESSHIINKNKYIFSGF